LFLLQFNLSIDRGATLSTGSQVEWASLTGAVYSRSEQLTLERDKPNDHDRSRRYIDVLSHAPNASRFLATYKRIGDVFGMLDQRFYHHYTRHTKASSLWRLVHVPSKISYIFLRRVCRFRITFLWRELRLKSHSK
jgi:hypothetical protein